MKDSSYGDDGNREDVSGSSSMDHRRIIDEVGCTGRSNYIKGQLNLTFK